MTRPSATPADDRLDVPSTNAKSPEASKQTATPAAATSASSPLVQLLRASEIVMEPVIWLWPEWIAAGKLHILAGAPSTGKTTLALSLAATITRGGIWPDGTRCAHPGDVLIWSGEDGPADTLSPRLAAAGADLERVHFVGDVIGETGGDRSFDPAQDMARLLGTVENLSTLPRLLIVDPVVSAVLGDSHKNAEVRRGLQPLVDFGRRLGVAIIGITHFSKATAGRDLLERINGSLAFGALARFVFATAIDKATQRRDRRVFVRAKSNLGLSGDGFAYELVNADLGSGLGAASVRWLERLRGDAQAIFAQAEPAEEDRSMTEEAVDLLSDVLASGRVLSNTVKQRASDAGISAKALRDARERLGVQVMREGFGPDTKTYWCLPAPSVAPSGGIYASPDEGARLDRRGRSGAGDE
jgi:putative DNA primase/helicase